MVIKQAELKKQAYSSDLKSRALSILIYLIDRANKDLTCFPAIPTMAADLHIGISTVKRALHELVDTGFIQKAARFRENNRGQSSNLYTLIFKEEARELTSSHENSPDHGNGIEPQTAVADRRKSQHITFADIVNTAKEETQSRPVPQKQTMAEPMQNIIPVHVSRLSPPARLVLFDKLKQLQSSIINNKKTGNFLPCKAFSILWTGAASSLMPP